MKAVIRCVSTGNGQWNKIEHRMFSFITKIWRGWPLVSHQAIVYLIARITGRVGLTVKASLDVNLSETAVKVSDEDIARL